MEFANDVAWLMGWFVIAGIGIGGSALLIDWAVRRSRPDVDLLYGWGDENDEWRV